MKKNSITAKAAAAALTALLVMGAAVPVFAAEDTDQPVSVIATPGETVSETVGNITLEPENTVAETGYAATVMAPQDSQAELNVEGNISTTATKTAENAFSGTPYGTLVEAFEGEASMNVSGDVQVSGDDINVFSIGVSEIAANDTASTSIEGDVTVSSGSGIGIDIMGGGDGESKASVEIGGDLTVENQGVAIGVQAQGGNMTQEVVIDGDITVSSEKYTAVALNPSNLESTTSIQVGGNVTSSTTGLQIILNPEATPTVDVLIEGTLAAKEDPVLIVGEEGDANVTLTAWEIVPNADGKIVTCSEGLEDKAAELESNILYIIRLEQPAAGGTVSLSGTTDSHGFAAAKEGDTVTLKATVQDGYKLTGAYNGTTALTLVDKDGNYYIVVPKGGGVSLSVLLEQIQSNVVPVTPATPAAAAVEEAPAAEKNLIDEYAFTADESDAKVSFYDDMTFTLSLPDGAELQGTFAFADGKLTFNGIELSVTIDEADGSYHCVYTLADGTQIEFVLSAEFVEKLMNACV